MNFVQKMCFLAFCNNNCIIILFIFQITFLSYEREINFINIVKINMTHPNYVFHHIGVYLNALVSFVKMNIDHFFCDRNFLVEPFLVIKNFETPNFPITELGNQKFSFTNFWWPQLVTKILLIMPKNVLGITQKKIVIQLKWFDFDH